MSNQSAKAAIAALFYALVELGAYGFTSTMAIPALEIGAVSLLLMSVRGNARGLRLLAMFVFAIAGVLARSHADVAALGPLGLILSLQVARWRTDGGDSAAAIERAMILVVTCFSAGLLLSTAAGYYLEEWLTSAVSATASLFLPGSTDLGPTFSGTRAAVAAAVAVAAWGQTNWRLPAALGISAVAASACVAVVARLMPEFGSSAGWFAGGLVAAQLPWLSAVIVAGGGFLLMKKANESEPGCRRAAVAMLLAGAAVLASMPASPRPSSQSIYFYEPGYQNWERPDSEFVNTGNYSAGMMGTLPDFSRAAGMRAEVGEDLSREKLEKFDTLVFLNQSDDLPEGAAERIESWVANGGRLVVVGDHTFLIENEGKKARIFLNDPMPFADIRFPNNSADYLTHGFKGATTTCGLGQSHACSEGNPSAVAIGAGLEVEWPARPLVIGRYGFNDAGVTEPGAGFIGDLIWNAGERLGDVVLLATQSHGKGDVLVVGDTTGVTNIGRSFTWRTWSMLLRGDYGESRWTYWLSGLALLACGLCSMRRTRLIASGLVATSVVAIAATTSGRTLIDDDALNESTVPIGIIDTSTRPAGRLGDWEFTGRLAQMNTLVRCGRIPVFASVTEAAPMEAADVILVTAPQVDPGKAWTESIVQWVERGGHLIISASYPDVHNIKHLLDDIGVSFDGHLLGALRADMGVVDGRRQRIDLAEPWRLQFEVSTWTPLVYSGNGVAVGGRDLGAGQVTVIGDGTFLTNEYLEFRGGANLDNLHVLKLLIERKLLKGEGA